MIEKKEEQNTKDINKLPEYEEEKPKTQVSKWYAKGLHFQCTECGKCCTGAPGYVWVQESEMQAMADFLNLSLKDFMRLYIRRVGNRYSLVESTITYDCVFLKNRKCRVYGARPTQCRSFPWWPQYLHSPEAWAEAAKTCEGINSEAPLIPFEKIEAEVLIQLGRHEPEL
jgi:Fe-S-cluster containining protein